MANRVLEASRSPSPRAYRLAFAWFMNRHLGDRGAGRMSKPFLRIAVGAVAVSVASMLLAVAVAIGFQNQIADRTIGFVGHVQIVNLDTNSSFEQSPIKTDSLTLAQWRELEHVVDATRYAYKPGIIKTKDEMQGCLLKGVDSTANLSFYQTYLERGRLPFFGGLSPSNEVLIGRATADRLRLDTGSKLTVYFVEQPPRVRRFTVVGVFNTQYADYDETYLLGDLRQVQRLNGWDPDQAGGIELKVDEFAHLGAVTEAATDKAYSTIEENGTLLRAVDVRDKYSAIFDWLAMQDMNVVVLLTLLLAVAGVNMVTALLILILEGTRTIGLLKSMGATMRQLRALFLLRACRILIIGLAIGNSVGLGLLASQWYWRWIKLNPADYYISYVPVEMQLSHFLAINILTICVTLLMMLLPSGLIARVSPSESIRFT